MVWLSTPIFYFGYVRDKNESGSGFNRFMELDLHTLRNADRGVAAAWALKQQNWLFICADHDKGHPSQFVADRLMKRGDSVSFVCPQCAGEDKRIKGKKVSNSIENADIEVSVIALFGVEDLWTLLPQLSQRMQWYGDVKAIWPERHQFNERWNSELYDYGVAVVNGESLGVRLRDPEYCL